MKERGIIMSGQNPKLILDGRKTQTRRIVKFPDRLLDDGAMPAICHGFGDWGSSVGWSFYVAGTGNKTLECPWGVAGDRLWVRETFQITRYWKHAPNRIRLDGYYLSDGRPFCVVLTADESAKFRKWKRKTGNFPSIFMFRSMSRISREITKVRVERLQDISRADAEAEGIKCRHCKGYTDNRTGCTCIKHYATLWDSLYGKGAWEKNPWVWVLEFKCA
jgi:hypothetical protein